jgi:hypothetical protein
MYPRTIDFVLGLESADGFHIAKVKKISEKFLRVGPYTDTDPHYPALIQTRPAHMQDTHFPQQPAAAQAANAAPAHANAAATPAQPAMPPIAPPAAGVPPHPSVVQPTAATAPPVPQLSAVELIEQKSLINGQIRYFVLASDGQEYELLTEFKLMTPLMWQTLVFDSSVNTDSKGEHFTSRFCYASGYKKTSRKRLAIPGLAG